MNAVLTVTKGGHALLAQMTVAVCCHCRLEALAVAGLNQRTVTQRNSSVNNSKAALWRLLGGLQAPGGHGE